MPVGRIAVAGALAFALLTPATAGAALTAARFGKGIAETRPGRILVAADNGSGARVLARGWSSYMSPDGARVAVITEGALELYATTGGPALWASRDLACGPVEWAPDASKLACVTAGESLVLLDAATGAVDTLASGSYLGMSFSPDSNRLAYVDVLDTSGRGTLNVLDLSTRTITRLRGSAILPVWGPETIAFGLASGGRNPRFDVAVVRPDGTGFRRLTRYRADSSHRGLVPRAWSADGRRLLAGVRGDDFTSFEAYAVDPVRGGARLISRGVSPDALTRDGRSVIGQTGSAATTGLYGSTVVRLPWRGGKPRVLLRHAVNPSSSE